MKSFIYLLAPLLFIAEIGYTQPTISELTGTWSGEYTGYDPNTASNVTIRRTLILDNSFNYCDTLWGTPSGSDEIVFETERGTWAFNADKDSLIWTPVESKRIDISDPDSLVIYERGIHRGLIDLTNNNKDWQFFDDNLGVGYSLKLVEEVTRPLTPVGETHPLISETYTYKTYTANSNYEHIVVYSFTWGDGTSSSWLADTSAMHSWSSIGIKYVVVTARCNTETDVSSTSDTLVVNVNDGIEELSMPGTPTGETTPEFNISNVYATTGSTSNIGHVIEYSFNWDDGTRSAWSTSLSASHSWSNGGIKYVSVTARCQIDTLISTASDTLEVNVIIETISIPSRPDGKQLLQPGEEVEFSTEGSVSDFGHTIEYSFNWDDNTRSGWSTNLNALHSWTESGGKFITVTSRCQTDTVISATSDTLALNIIIETLSNPSPPTGENTPFQGVAYTYTTQGSFSNLEGHIIEYSFDWDDGSTSAWSTSTSSSHSWVSLGVKNISASARCQVDTSLTKTSDSFTVNVLTNSVGIESYADNSINLLSALPNPFTDKTRIYYQIPETAAVTLSIYNMQGQVIKNLVNKTQPSDNYEVTWYGDDNQGNRVAGGVYFIYLVSGKNINSQRVIFQY